MNFTAMNNQNLPLYAIVELLIRISSFDDRIGDYKNHSLIGQSINVITNKGLVILPSQLVAKQFSTPQTITIEELLQVAATFVKI
jgi:hypothetical protein